MILTGDMMGWLVLTALCLCLPVWSTVSVIQPYSVLSTNGTARIRCFIQPRPTYHQDQSPGDHSPPYPYPDPEEFRVTLLRGLHGTRELCSIMVDVREPQRSAGVRTDGQVRCAAQVSEDAVVVTVSGLKATDTDIYRCDIMVFFPPPYLRHTGNGTLVHVRESCPEPAAEGQVAPNRDEEEEEDDDGSDEAVTSFPVVVLVTLVVLVLIVIVVFQALQCQRRRREVVRTVPGGAHKVEAVSITCGNSE